MVYKKDPDSKAHYAIHNGMEASACLAAPSTLKRSRRRIFYRTSLLSKPQGPEEKPGACKNVAKRVVLLGVPLCETPVQGKFPTIKVFEPTMVDASPVSVSMEAPRSMILQLHSGDRSTSGGCCNKGWGELILATQHLCDGAHKILLLTVSL